MSVYQFSFCNARGLRIQFIHTRAGIFSPIIFFGMDNLFRGYTIAAIAYSDNGFGYINVGDGCGIKLILVTNFRCWCSNWDVDDVFLYENVSSTTIQSPTSLFPICECCWEQYKMVTDAEMLLFLKEFQFKWINLSPFLSPISEQHRRSCFWERDLCQGSHDL